MSNPEDWDHIYCNVNLVTLAGSDQSGGCIIDGALATRDGLIAWVGPQRELPTGYRGTPEDCEGRWMTPGLIDCHTHLIYCGNRISEFEQRLNGTSYQQLAKNGGGIMSTVRATRAATENELYDATAQRLVHFIRDGVTTIEIKSGYGLDMNTEIKMLRVARRLGQSFPVNIVTTFLGAHGVPPEYAANREEYIQRLCDEMIPYIARENLADAVDCFCENIAFSPTETSRIFDAARSCGLRVKLHADQLSDSSGAALAAKYNALSADHLEFTSSSSVDAMARSGTVAVLLPGAFYALGETKLPPIEALRSSGVPMAIASDSNPGSSPVLSLRMMMNMACTLFGLTPFEALQGVTVHAARALGLADRGQLVPGLRADLALWNITEPAELAYAIGGQLCHQGIVDK